MNRRNFIQLSGLGSLPVVAGGWNGLAGYTEGHENRLPLPEEAIPVSFARDGPGFTPAEYVAKLQEINHLQPIQPDSNGEHGAVDELLKKFTAMTGKEAAIFLTPCTFVFINTSVRIPAPSFADQRISSIP
jgi:threonine aldolase